MNARKIQKPNQQKGEHFIISLIMFAFAFLFTVFLFGILSLFSFWGKLNQVFVKRNQIYALAKQAFPLFQILVDLPGFTVLALFFYNYLNTYKCLVLVQSFSLSQYISSILQLMFNDVKPFSGDHFSSCSNLMGNPNRKSIISVAMYLTLWKTIVSSGEVKGRRRIRAILLIIAIEIIVIINIVNLCSQNYAFHQILFGTVLGVFIYYFMFKVIGIDMNNPKQFLAFINTRWYWMALMNALFSLLLVLSSKIHSVNNEGVIELLHKTRQASCETFSLAPSSKKEDRLKEELIINASIIFINIGFYIALNLERRFFFENNAELYGKFHFNHYDFKSESFTSELIATKDNQWNNTEPLKSLIRLFIGIFAFSALLAFFIFFIAGYTHNFYAFLSEEILFSNGLIVFFFFVLKIALKRMKLINMKIYQVPLLIVHNIDEEVNVHTNSAE